MAITISGENNNDRILASDGVIDQLSGFNVVGVMTATSFTGDLTGDVTGNLTGNVTGNINNTTLLLQTGGTERLRIDSSGRVLIGTTTEGFAEGDDLTINSADHGGITIRTPTNKEGNLAFSDTTSGTGEYSGLIRYRHSQNDLGLWTNSLLRLLIDSSGRVMIGNTNASTMFGGADDLVVGNTTGAHGITIITQNNTIGRLLFSDSTSAGAATYQGQINYNHSTEELDLRTYTGGAITFATGNTERARIKSNGWMGLGTNNPSSPFVVSDGDQGFEVHPNSSSTVRLLAFDRTNSVRKNLRIDALAYEIQCNNGTERLRIDSAGRIGIGENSPGSYSSGAYNLVISAPSGSNSGITINSDSGGTDSGAIFFSHGTASGANGVGRIRYYHSDDHMDFYTANAERLRILSTGELIVGHTAAPFSDGDPLQLVSTSSGEGLIISNYSASDYGTQIAFLKSRSAAVGNTILQSGDRIGELNFYGNDGSGRSLGAQISVRVSDTPSNNNTPSTINFNTGLNQSMTTKLKVTPTDVEIRGSAKLILPSSSSGDYIRMYAGSGTGKWDIYSNSQYLRITDNDSAGSVRTDCRLGVGSAASHANLCSRITATGAIPTTALIQTNNDNHALQLWNQSNSATYCGLMLETRTSQASGWLIANEWQSNYKGDLVFRGRSGASSSEERMRIRSDGHVQLQHGLTGLSGGGVIVCAAKSSTGTANQSNYKVDFVVPMGDLGTKQEYEDIRAQFGSGQTGTDWSHALGGSGILIATVQNNYYWGFRTKIYHITTYGNSSNNVTQLNLLHNYSAAGHGGNSAAVDLAVQSHDGKTPKLRATFSGDYWNSNVLTVTYIGSAVASTGNIRQLTTFDSKLTGQDPTWK